MAVIAAFVAGTIATATPVFAPPPGDDGEGGWKAAIAEQQQIDELKANEILGFYLTFDGGMGDGGFENRDALCDPGDSVTGGGFQTTNEESPIGSAKVLDGWSVEWFDTLNGASYTAIAICADYAPVHVDP